ncbi:MAG: contractile injection system protein, VgrG/Pvc8 family, partial [Iodobacter sp.]
MSTPIQTQSFMLTIQQQPSALFSVFAFEAEEALNAPYWVEIQATCPLPHLAMDDILGRSACFSIQPVIAGLPARNTLQRPEPRFFHGVITQFKKLRSNHEETLYSLRLEPRMAAALRPTQASRIIQNSS